MPDTSYWICPKCGAIDRFVSTGFPLGGPGNPYGEDLGQYRECKDCHHRYHLAAGQLDPNVRKMPAPTWHRGRDDYGTILGPNLNGEGYPIIAQGIRLVDARLRYPDVVECGPIPIVIDRPDTSSAE